MAAGREPEVDPREFVRNVLHISPEDAEKVRERSPATRPRKPTEDEVPRGQHGPTETFGEA